MAQPKPSAAQLARLQAAHVAISALAKDKHPQATNETHPRYCAVYKQAGGRCRKYYAVWGNWSRVQQLLAKRKYAGVQFYDGGGNSVWIWVGTQPPAVTAYKRETARVCKA